MAAKPAPPRLAAPQTTREAVPTLGLTFELTRKPIKRAYLRVRAPDGQITVNAPRELPMAMIHALITQHHAWIIKNQTRLLQQPPAPDAGALESGQTLPILGEPHRLHFEPNAARDHIECRAGVLSLQSRRALSTDQRRALIHHYLRARLHGIAQERLSFWSAKLGVSARFFGIKRMKTRWGSCNIRERRIWINLELARMPVGCLDLVLVHELTHLFERGHNARFYGLMDQFLPDWRAREAELKRWGMWGL